MSIFIRSILTRAGSTQSPLVSSLSVPLRSNQSYSTLFQVCALPCQINAERLSLGSFYATVKIHTIVILDVIENAAAFPGHLIEFLWSAEVLKYILLFPTHTMDSIVVQMRTTR